MRIPLLATLVAFPGVLLGSGCAIVSSVETSDEVAMRAALEVGDRIAVTTSKNYWYALTIASLSDVGMSATTPSDAVLTIPYEEISRLEVIEPRPVRTALGVTGAFAFSAAMAVEYPAYFLASVLLFWD